MTLIHTALQCEAQPIIEKFKLKQFQKQSYKIYKKDDLLLVISGIGKEKTIASLEDIFSKYKFDKAINIGIAGCKEKSVDIGTFYDLSFNPKLLTTVDKPLDNKENLETLLVDMEAKYFRDMSNKYVTQNNIKVYKVVSDYLDKAIPKKSFVSMLIYDTLDKWCGDLE